MHVWQPHVLPPWFFYVVHAPLIWPHARAICPHAHVQPGTKRVVGGGVGSEWARSMPCSAALARACQHKERHAHHLQAPIEPTHSALSKPPAHSPLIQPFGAGVHVRRGGVPAPWIVLAATGGARNGHLLVAQRKVLLNSPARACRPNQSTKLMSSEQHAGSGGAGKDRWRAPLCTAAQAGHAHSRHLHNRSPSPGANGLTSAVAGH